MKCPGCQHSDRPAPGGYRTAETYCAKRKAWFFLLSPRELKRLHRDSKLLQANDNSTLTALVKE